MNLAIRWFTGYRLHEDLPHHSSLTRIRQRWGAEKFKKVFAKSVASCAQAGLVNGETVHVDATLIRADVSWASLTEVHAERVITENDGDGDDPDSGGSPKRGRPRKGPIKPKKRSRTDPDATLTTSSKQERMEPRYKQHTAVDDETGIIIDVALTTGEASEGEQLPEQIERIEAASGKKIKLLTADGAYAHAKNFAFLEERETEGVIPPAPETQRRHPRLPKRRFKYDSRHNLVRCPGGKTLRRSTSNEAGIIFRARTQDCRCCVLLPRCISPSANSRTILIVHGHEALIRARRKRLRWDAFTKKMYQRHRWRAEGVHGEGKTQHGLRRAVRRGLGNVAIQVYLTAAVINLKRLAAFACAHILASGPRLRFQMDIHKPGTYFISTFAARLQEVSFENKAA